MAWGGGGVGRYVSLAVGRFGEFSREFVNLRDCIARQRAYAYIDHFNSWVNRAMSMFQLNITSRWEHYIARQRAYAYIDHFNSWVNRAMSMFQLNITSRWALMAGLILNRRRDLINDRPNRATAAAPLDGAQERYQFDNSRMHTRGAYHHGEAA